MNKEAVRVPEDPDRCLESVTRPRISWIQGVGLHESSPPRPWLSPLDTCHCDLGIMQWVFRAVESLDNNRIPCFTRQTRRGGAGDSNRIMTIGQLDLEM